MTMVPTMIAAELRREISDVIEVASSGVTKSYTSLAE